MGGRTFGVAMEGRRRYGFHVGDARLRAPIPEESRHAMTPDQSASFAAGQHCASLVASCVARLAAAELMKDAHWWSRRRRGLMARTLITYADELETLAEADAAGAQAIR